MIESQSAGELREAQRQAPGPEAKIQEPQACASDVVQLHSESEEKAETASVLVRDDPAGTGASSAALFVISTFSSS